MPEITGSYERIKEPRLRFTYSGSYEVGQVINWAVAVHRGHELVGKPNGRIEIDGLPSKLVDRAVLIAVTASIENGTSMRE